MNFYVRSSLVKLVHNTYYVPCLGKQTSILKHCVMKKNTMTQRVIVKTRLAFLMFYLFLQNLMHVFQPHFWSFFSNSSQTFAPYLAANFTHSSGSIQWPKNIGIFWGNSLIKVAADWKPEENKGLTSRICWEILVYE